MSLHHRTDIDHRALPGGVTLTTVSAGRPGRSLALLGGVHGDEDEGVLATLRVVCEAAAITEHVIARADALVDLHSAGLRYRMPLMSGFCADTHEHTTSRRLAEAFGTPLIWAHPHVAKGRSLSAAADHGIPAIYAECSGGGSVRANELDVYVSGVRSVMAELGMLPRAYRRVAATTRWVRGDGDLDQGSQATHHGLFVSAVRAGDAVATGAELGRFYDYTGELIHTVDAPADGVVMFLRRQARTETGDVLFMLAEAEADDDERRPR